MKEIEITFSDEEKLNGTMSCPECGKSWVDVIDGDACRPQRIECPHLRFIIEPGVEGANESEYFNGFTKEQLLRAVKKAYLQLEPDDAGMTDEEIFRDNMYNGDMWARVEMEEADTLLDYTQEYMRCGPSSDTAYFGMKSGNATDK